jgi:nucleotide-binding universal stress UspA family protein
MRRDALPHRDRADPALRGAAVRRFRRISPPAPGSWRSCCSPARHEACLAADSVRWRALAEHLLIVARKLVIGYDGTPEGEDALALARVLAPPLGAAELVAVCVKAVPHPRPRGHGWRERLEQEAERTFAGATGEDLGRRAVVSSSPARGLFELAESERADLLVVGSSHHSGLGAVLAGSVGRALLHGAPCPVALAHGHRPARARLARLRRGASHMAGLGHGRARAVGALPTAPGSARRSRRRVGARGAGPATRRARSAARRRPGRGRAG